MVYHKSKKCEDPDCLHCKMNDLKMYGIAIGLDVGITDFHEENQMYEVYVSKPNTNFSKHTLAEVEDAEFQDYLASKSLT